MLCQDVESVDSVPVTVLPSAVLTRVTEDSVPPATDTVTGVVGFTALLAAGVAVMTAGAAPSCAGEPIVEEDGCRCGEGPEEWS